MAARPEMTEGFALSIAWRAAGLTTGDFGWGSKTFAKMGRKKINLIAKFLELGVNVSDGGGVGGRGCR